MYNMNPKSIEQIALWVRLCDLPKIKENVKTIRDVTRVDKDGDNLLINAIDTKCDNKEIIEYLIKLDKDKKVDIVNIRNHKEQTPLWIVSSRPRCDIGIIKLLVENGANIDDVSTKNSTPLFIASQVRNKNVVTYLLEKGANINTITALGYSALSIVAYKGYLDLVKILVENKANINHDGFSPIYMAVLGGNLQIVKYLCEKGADINAKITNDDEESAFILAAHEGHLPILKYLLDNGAKIDITDRHLQTPLIVAVEAMHVDIVRYFLKSANVTVDSRDDNDYTAFEIAFQLLTELETYKSMRKYSTEILEIFCIFITYYTTIDTTNVFFHEIINRLCDDPKYKSSKKTLNDYLKKYHKEINLQNLCEIEEPTVAKWVEIPETDTIITNTNTNNSSTEARVVEAEPIVYGDVDHESESLNSEYYNTSRGREYLVRMTGVENLNDRIPKPANMPVDTDTRRGGGKKRKTRTTKKNKRNVKNKKTRHDR